MKAVRDIFDKHLSHDVTLEEAKQLECCKGLTDEQILELIEAVKVLTEMVYSVYSKQKKRGGEKDDLKHAA